MTKSAAPSTAKIVEMLKKHDRGVVADILAQVDIASAQEKQGNNVELRKKAHLKALAENNKLAIDKVDRAADEMMGKGQEIAARSESMMENGMTEEDAVDAMRTFLSGKIVAEAQSSIQDLIRSLVFRHMDLCAAEMGEEFPENTNMVFDVPETNKRFCREGAGRKDAEFDMDRLLELLGPEMFAQVTIPKVTYEVNDSALSAAILSDPELMERLRDVIVPGEWKSPRLMVRDIPANEKE